MTEKISLTGKAATIDFAAEKIQGYYSHLQKECFYIPFREIDRLLGYPEGWLLATMGVAKPEAYCHGPSYTPLRVNWGFSGEWFQLGGEPCLAMRDLNVLIQYAAISDANPEAIRLIRALSAIGLENLFGVGFGLPAEFGFTPSCFKEEMARELDDR
jgi:hypothetical protein